MRRNLPKIQNLLSLSEVPGKGNYFRYLTLSQNSTSCAEKASSIIGLLFFFSPFKNKKRKTFFFFFAKRMSHWDGIRLYFSCLICNFLRVVECLGLPRCYWMELLLSSSCESRLLFNSAMQMSSWMNELWLWWLVWATNSPGEISPHRPFPPPILSTPWTTAT